MSVTFQFPMSDAPCEKTEEITVVARCRGKWLLLLRAGALGLLRGAVSMDPDVEIPAWIGEVFCAEAQSLTFIEEYECEGVRGALYLADLPDACELPESVHAVLLLPAEVREEDRMLFSRVQYRLNLRTSAQELWDVLDGDRRPTGRTHPRGIPLPEGEYHTVVLILLQNAKGEYLITRRAPNKGFPNMWEFTGGSALAGDDSRSAAVREVLEETGIVLDPAKGRLLSTERRNDCFMDLWHFDCDFDLSAVTLQEGETTTARAATREEIVQMERDGEFIPFTWELKNYMGNN